MRRCCTLNKYRKGHAPLEDWGAAFRHPAPAGALEPPVDGVVAWRSAVRRQPPDVCPYRVDSSTPAACQSLCPDPRKHMAVGTHRPVICGQGSCGAARRRLAMPHHAPPRRATPLLLPSTRRHCKDATLFTVCLPYPEAQPFHSFYFFFQRE